MQPILKALRYAPPFLFLAYAAVANWAVFHDGLGPLSSDDAWSGGMTREIGGLYTADQPHRDTAISAVGAARYLLLGEGRDGVTVGRDGWLFTDEEWQAASDAQIDRAVEQVKDARAEIDDLGAKLVVVPVPAKIDIYRGRAEGGDRAGEVMAAQYRAFREALRAEGVEVVDTRDALERSAADEQVFLTRDTHWTPHGAARVAEEVAASGLVPEGETNFARSADRPEEFVGDLVSFVTSDSLAPSVGLGPERVTPYVAKEKDAAQGGIFAGGDSQADTVLIGTSYSANTNWSFAPALKLALGRDVLNLAKEGQGPVQPMLDWLDGPAEAGPAPDYVIWEYPVRYLGVRAREETL